MELLRTIYPNAESLKLNLEPCTLAESPVAHREHYYKIKSACVQMCHQEPPPEPQELTHEGNTHSAPK